MTLGDELDYLPLDVNTVPLDGRTLIEASAGTGKTWTITGLYVRLIVEKHLTVEQILVVTYTKAATAELRGRIRGRLVECLQALQGVPGDSFCEGLIASLPDKVAVEEARKRLTRAIQGFDEAAVYTIHGYCQRVLADSAFESGMDFDLDVLPNVDALLREILADAWRQESDRASLMWAAYLQEKKQTPSQWLKAIRSHLGKPYQQFLSLAALPEMAAEEEAFSKAFLSAATLWQQEKETILECLADLSSLNGNIYKQDRVAKQAVTISHWLAGPAVFIVEKEVALFSSNKLAASVKKGKTAPQHPFFDTCSDLLSTQKALENNFDLRLKHLRLELLKRCDGELIVRKRQQQMLSYDDLLNRLADALEGPNGEHLASLLAKTYPAALVDEFQDTDPVQYRIFSNIYRQPDSPLFMVGDPKQAIYSFRGADLFSYLSARTAASAHYTLAVNQRSVPPLITALNDLFQPAGLSYPFMTEQVKYWPVEASERDKGVLLVEGETNNAALRFLCWHSTDSDSSAKKFSKEISQGLALNGMVSEIVRLLQAAQSGQACISTQEKSQPLKGGDIAVLVSSHRQGILVQQALAEKGVPAVRQGQDNVFRSAEANEFRLVLLAIAEPVTASFLRTALATRLWSGDGNYIAGLAEDEQGWEALQDKVLELHQLWQKYGFMGMFRQWLSDFTIVPHLLSQQGGERLLTNLLHLAELIQLESRRLHTIEQLLSWFTRTISDEEESHDEVRQLRLESDASRVKIVTIHGSKGLEYPIVFCPFLWDGSLQLDKNEILAFHDPAQNFRACLDAGSEQQQQNLALAEQETLGEKLRLLYVALTRAKHRCYILWGACKNDAQSTAALSWLLYARDTLLATDGENPVDAMREIITIEMTDDECLAPLKQLASNHPDAVSIEPCVTQSVSPLVLSDKAAPLTGVPLQPCASQRGPLYQQWRMSSFSGLSAGRATEQPDHDSADRPAEDELVEEEENFFTFPRGAGPGNCLHAIFEDWDFASQDHQALQQLVNRRLKVAAIDEKWTDVVTEQVFQILNAELGDQYRFSLAELPLTARRAEMEFTYRLNQLSLPHLRTVLADPRAGLPDIFIQQLDRLEFQQIHGYMKGFIDLVFQAGEQFYVLDWKSNWLGNQFQDYSHQRMQEAIAHAHYYLQYLIYTVALHHYLRLRIEDYDYDHHIGGVYYFFLRGISAEDATTGIYFHKPNAWLIERLASLFEMGPGK